MIAAKLSSTKCLKAMKGWKPCFGGDAFGCSSTVDGRPLSGLESLRSSARRESPGANQEDHDALRPSSSFAMMVAMRWMWSEVVSRRQEHVCFTRTRARTGGGAAGPGHEVRGELTEGADIELSAVTGHEFTYGSTVECLYLKCVVISSWSTLDSTSMPAI